MQSLGRLRVRVRRGFVASVVGPVAVYQHRSVRGTRTRHLLRRLGLGLEFGLGVGLLAAHNSRLLQGTLLHGRRRGRGTESQRDNKREGNGARVHDQVVRSCVGLFVDGITVGGEQRTAMGNSLSLADRFYAFPWARMTPRQRLAANNESGRCFRLRYIEISE
jgi:hypothetical protein